MSRVSNSFPRTSKAHRSLFMTVSSTTLITRKLSSHPSQEDRFRALDRALARRYVLHMLREQNIALDRRVRQGSLVYKPRYAILLNHHLPVC